MEAAGSGLSFLATKRRNWVIFDGDRVKWDNAMPRFGLIFEINCADNGDICRTTTNLHRGVTYQNEEKDVAETMKHYGGAAKC